MDVWGTLATVVITAIGSVGFWQYMQSRAERLTREKQGDAAAAKDHADAVLTVTEAGGKTLKMAFDMLEAQKQESERLRCKVDDLDRTVTKANQKLGRMEWAIADFTERINYLMGGIAILIGQITDAKETPCWQPDEWQPPSIEE